MHKFKLRTIFIVFVSFALVFLTLVATTMNMVQFSNLYYDKTEHNDLPNAVGRIAEQIKVQLMPALLTAENMSDNLMLHDWMLNGEIESPQNEQVMAYFKKQQQDIGASTLFWVSAKTLAYYTEAGYFKHVSETEARDQWFFNFMAGNEKQNLTLDPDERNGKLTLFVNTQVRIQGEPVAATGVGYDVTEIADLITQYKVGEKGFLFLVDENKRITVHPDIGLTNQLTHQVKSYEPIDQALNAHQAGFNLQQGQLNNESVYIAVQSIEGTPLKLIAIQPLAEISGAINQLISYTVLISLLLTVVFVVITVLFANSLSRLIRNVGDDLLNMSGHGGDLTHRLDDSFDNELGHLAKGFNAIIAKIRELVAEIQITEVAMKTSIEQIADLAQNTFDATNAQRGETDQVATAITEMGQTISEVTGVAQQTAADTEAAVQDTQQTGDNMNTTAHTMEQLNGVMQSIENTIAEFAEQATAIQSFVEIINGISEQTNLLALNAAIEAARAGEQGRGFAVVADEVRNLARRTQESTLEIGEQVSVLQATAQRSTQAIQQGTHNSQEVLGHALEAAEALSQIQQKFNAIRDGNHQVAAATEEQSSVVEHINESAQSISNSAADIHKNAEHQIESITELQARAEHLRQLVTQFKV